jgi:hypothetical protein
MKTALEMMVPPNVAVHATPPNYADYVDPHYWWQGGEGIAYEVENDTGGKINRLISRDSSKA